MLLLSKSVKIKKNRKLNNAHAVLNFFYEQRVGHEITEDSEVEITYVKQFRRKACDRQMQKRKKKKMFMRNPNLLPRHLLQTFYSTILKTNSQPIVFVDRLTVPTERR